MRPPIRLAGGIIIDGLVGIIVGIEV
jgi:hypothetical protein